MIPLIDRSLLEQQIARAIAHVEKSDYHKAAFCLKCGSFDSTRTNSPLRELCDHDGIYDKENGPVVYKVRNGVDQIRPIKIFLDAERKTGDSSE